MKVFRWKLKPEYKEEYFLTMKKSEELISIKYQIDTIQNILLHNSKRYGQNKINMDLLLNKMYNNLYINIGIEKKSLSLDEISDELDDKINVIFKDNIYYYLDKLINKEDSIQIIKQILIGKKAQKPIYQQQLLESKNSCPFFSNDYNKLYELSQRIQIDKDIIINCFSKVAIEYDLSLDKIIEDVFPKNNLSIIIDNQNIAKYDLKDLKLLQLYIMIN
jgi:hypothetical protein